LPKELEDSISWPGAKLLEGAQIEIVRLVKLSNDLLDFARMEDGKIELDIQEIAVDDMLQRSLDSVRPLAETVDVILLCLVSAVVGHRRQYQLLSPATIPRYKFGFHS
jgi:signal transduction histidine kinase